MWMVFLHGGWQPADNDAIVVAWIQQGLVGPQTQIRHSSWPQPTMLGMVPNFQGYFAAPATHSQSFPGYAPQSVHGQVRTTAGLPKSSNTLLWKIVGALFVVGILGAFTSGFTESSAFVGALVLLVAVALAGVMIAAKFVEAAPPAVRQVGQAMLSWPFLTIPFVVGLGLGPLSGFSSRSTFHAQCDSAVDAVTKAQNDKVTFNGADPMAQMKVLNATINQGRTACERIGATSKIATLDAAAPQLEQRATAASAEAASVAEKAKAASDKAAAEKRESDAVASFAADAKTIADNLKTAVTEANAGKWEAAETKLNVARDSIASYKGTSVEKSEQCITLAKQEADQRAKIQPQLDKLAADRKKVADAAAKKEADANAATAALAIVRGPKPTNSAWDGSILCVEQYLKKVLNDPGSYEHVSTTVPVGIGDYWVVKSTFRGKNAFGAKVVNTKLFSIQQSAVVKVADVE